MQSIDERFGAVSACVALRVTGVVSGYVFWYASVEGFESRDNDRSYGHDPVGDVSNLELYSD